MAQTHSTPGPPARPDQATAEDLKSVLPITAEVRGGHLCVGGVDMVELARRRARRSTSWTRRRSATSCAST